MSITLIYNIILYLYPPARVCHISGHCGWAISGNIQSGKKSRYSFATQYVRWLVTQTAENKSPSSSLFLGDFQLTLYFPKRLGYTMRMQNELKKGFLFFTFCTILHVKYGACDLFRSRDFGSKMKNEILGNWCISIKKKFWGKKGTNRKNSFNGFPPKIEELFSIWAWMTNYIPTGQPFEAPSHAPKGLVTLLSSCLTYSETMPRLGT